MLSNFDHNSTSSYDYNNNNNAYADSYGSDNGDEVTPGGGGDDNNNHKKNGQSTSKWILSISLFVITVLALLSIRYLCDQSEKTVKHYEDYIHQSRDSFVAVIEDISRRVDSLKSLKSRLQGIILIKDGQISKLRRKIATMDHKTLNECRAKVGLLEAQVNELESKVAGLKENNDTLMNRHKVLSDQVNEWKNKYDELYSKYMACCKDANLGGGDKKANAVLPSDDRYEVIAENAALGFEAFDNRGNAITDVEKISIKDVKTFSITFDAKSTKATEHMFYVRVTDSIQGNLVVPSNYPEVGKKILKLASGEELPYTFSIPYKFAKSNAIEKVTAKFNPYFKQIRHLPYRVEIYDSNGKLAEAYNRSPMTKKDRTRNKAKWLW